MKSGFALAIIGLIFLLVSEVQATPITWLLSDVTFQDGATASGSFVYDADTHTYNTWDIITTTTVNPGDIGFVSLNGLAYTTNNLTNASSNHFLNDTTFGIKSGTCVSCSTHPVDSTAQFGLVFSQALSNAGGTVLLKTIGGGGFEFQASGFKSRGVNGGAVMAAVPEPETYLLMMSGLGVLGWVVRRRQTI